MLSGQSAETVSGSLLASGCNLHLIKPLGFDISDKKVKRAGLDYWKYVNLHVYDNIDAFFEKHPHAEFALFSAKGVKYHWDLSYQKDMFLIFGKESVGLPSGLVEDNQDKLYKIPIHSSHIRSLNLANAVSIIVYEGLSQLRPKQ